MKNCQMMIVDPSPQSFAGTSFGFLMGWDGGFVVFPSEIRTQQSAIINPSREE
jgi:hypothetical protein